MKPALVLSATVMAVGVACAGPSPYLSDTAPCVSIPYAKYQSCGCHPNVAVVVDLLGQTRLPLSTQKVYEECLSAGGSADASFKGKSLVEVKAAVEQCVKRKVEVNKDALDSMDKVTATAVSRAPTPDEICRWMNCFYGRDGNCGPVARACNTKLDGPGEGAGVHFEPGSVRAEVVALDNGRVREFKLIRVAHSTFISNVAADLMGARLGATYPVTGDAKLEICTTALGPNGGGCYARPTKDPNGVVHLDNDDAGVGLRFTCE